MLNMILGTSREEYGVRNVFLEKGGIGERALNSERRDNDPIPAQFITEGEVSNPGGRGGDVGRGPWATDQT